MASGLSAAGFAVLPAASTYFLCVDLTASGIGMGCLPIRDMVCSYWTSATTSPPTRAWRASWPVMTPRDVETIAVPMPPRIFGTSSAPT